ncbi:MAG: N-acetylmuramoyl-L-alanine amidase [Dissulfurispiraceae bacterium]|jgi:N-acetylmuramoyl-L-alanine amidase
MTLLSKGLFNTVSLISLALQLFLFCGPAGTALTYAADNAGTFAGNQTARASTATLRVGKHASYLRLVFETPESYVEKASVSLSGANGIKVDFQSPISFMVPRKDAPKTFIRMETDASKSVTYEIDKGLRITAALNSCVIVVDNLDDISVSKLFSPSRLVIDAYINQSLHATVEKNTVEKNTAEENTAEVPVTAPEASDIKDESFAIDAGHGGYETGVRFGKTVEKDLALSFAKEFSGALLKIGKKVTLTRKGDQIISLRDRARIVNKKSPDLLISIHVSSKDEFVVYSFCLSCVKAAAGTGTNAEKTAGGNMSEVLARAIAQSARSALKITVRTEKMPLPLLSYVHVPSVLIELPSPDKFSYDAKTRERMIAIILQGIAYASASQVGA